MHETRALIEKLLKIIEELHEELQCTQQIVSNHPLEDHVTELITELRQDMDMQARLESLVEE